MRYAAFFFIIGLSLSRAQQDTIYTSAGFLKIFNNLDSVQYSKNYAFNDGIYLSYSDFRKTYAIPKSILLTGIEKNQLEFYNKLINERDSIVYRFGNGIRVALVDSIWGYCQNNVLYINLEGSFCRMSVFGNISHFIGSINVTAFNENGQFYDPSKQNGGNSITGGATLKTKQTNEFVFDFYSGNVEIADVSSLENILKRDYLLYTQFMLLSKRQKKNKMYEFLKAYNIKHPVYFPKQ